MTCDWRWWPTSLTGTGWCRRTRGSRSPTVPRWCSPTRTPASLPTPRSVLGPPGCCAVGPDLSVTLEVGHDGQHATVGGAVVMQPELGEDRTHVCLDRAFGEHEPLGDRTVGQALGHQCQDTSLAIRQPVHGRSRRGAHEGMDDLGVECTAAQCHALRGGDEVRQVDDAVLEEVAEARGTDQ